MDSLDPTLLRLLIEEARDYAIHALSCDGIVTTWNTGAERMHGYRAAEVLGTSGARFFTPEDISAGRLQRALGLALAQGRAQEESWRVRRDGSRFWAESVLSALRDDAGRPVGLSLLTRDLTARRGEEQRQEELAPEPAARAAAEALAAELRATEERYRQANLQLSAVVEGVTDGITMQDPSGRIVFANRVAAQLLGASGGGVVGAVVSDALIDRFEIMDPSGAPLPLEDLPGRVVLRGEAAVERLVRFRVRATNEERWSLVRASPIHDDQGRVRFALTFFRDVTEKRQEERRRSFIASATVELNSSLDYETTLATVARLAVPTMADWCAVDVLEGDRVERLAVAHIDPAKIRLVAEIERRYPPDPAAPSGVPNILRTGEPEMMSDIPAALIDAAARDEEHLGLIRSLSLRSYVGVPLKARGRTLGVITFVMAESQRRYEAEDMEVAMTLAHRAAAAIDNARLFRDSLRDLEARRAAQDALAERVRMAAMNAEAAMALTRIENLPTILQRWTEVVVTHLDAAFARIWTLNAAGDTLELQASAGMYTHLDGPHSRVPVGQFKIGLIAAERRAYLTNAVAQDPRIGDPTWARRERV